MYFLNTYEYTVDDRGRVAIPSRIREAFGMSVILSRGPDGCLEIYTPAEFTKRAERFASANAPGRHQDRQVGRAFFGGSAEIEFDRQGRILIPAAFRQYADITGPVVIIGQGTYLELWSRSRWELEQSAVANNYAQALETMESRT